MSEEKDKRDLWRILTDPDYVTFIPTYKKNLKEIEERKEKERDRLTAQMKKLTSALGNINDD